MECLQPLWAENLLLVAEMLTRHLFHSRYSLQKVKMEVIWPKASSFLVKRWCRLLFESLKLAAGGL
jgi:hypothetical protein